MLNMDHGVDPEVWGRKNLEEKLDDVGREDVPGTCDMCHALVCCLLDFIVPLARSPQEEESENFKDFICMPGGSDGV